MKIGLKIDVDTLRGTRLGVLPLARLLADRGQRATFYFSVGPDNMGRHLFRLLKPAFLLKMLKSNAPGLYGWDILLKGTLGPGPRIGRRCESIIRQTADLGHEIGLHAWDHHGWQARAAHPRKGKAEVTNQLTRGMTELQRILGRPVTTSAAPGWQANADTALVKSGFTTLRYNSDCRGAYAFRPLLPDGTPSPQPQLPTTLPTYDELIGRNGITAATYNDHLLSLIAEASAKSPFQILCIHAEAEGLACHPLFRDFLTKALAASHTFCPLEDLLPADPATLPVARLDLHPVPGREGTLATIDPETPSKQ